jgi:hypothetical protein
MFSTPFAAFVDRFDACDANATNCPDPVLFGLMRGLSLSPLAGVVPSKVETSFVDAVHVVVAPAHVSRT